VRIGARAAQARNKLSIAAAAQRGAHMCVAAARRTAALPHRRTACT